MFDLLKNGFSTAALTYQNTDHQILHNDSRSKYIISQQELLEQLLNVPLKLLGFSPRAVPVSSPLISTALMRHNKERGVAPLDNLAVLINQELLEIPGDVSAATLFLPQKVIKRLRCRGRQTGLASCFTLNQNAHKRLVSTLGPIDVHLGTKEELGALPARKILYLQLYFR